MSTSTMEVKDIRGNEHTRGRRARRHRRRHYRILRFFSKNIVFWFTALLGLAGAVVPFVKGVLWIGVSIVACVFIARVVYVNDKRGFSKRKSKDNIHKLNIYESLVLGVLILLNITIVAWVLIR